MPKAKKVSSVHGPDKEHEASFRRMQSWYRIQRFAGEIYRSLDTAEAIDLFIDNARHELARMIPPRGDVA